MRSTVRSIREWMPSVSAVPLAAISSSSASNSSARQRTTWSTGPEYFVLQLAGAVEFDDRRRDISPAGGQRPRRRPSGSAARPARSMRGDPAFELLLAPRRRSPGRYGSPTSRGSPTFSSRAAPISMSSIGIGDVVLQAKQPQRRAALAGGAERRGDDVVGHLLGQRGGVDDHGVDAAGLGDQRHDRAALCRPARG